MTKSTLAGHHGPGPGAGQRATGSPAAAGSRIFHGQDKHHWTRRAANRAEERRARLQRRRGHIWRDTRHRLHESDPGRLVKPGEVPRSRQACVHRGFQSHGVRDEGTYLKALFEHLVNMSHVPDTKQLIRTFLPTVRLDDPGGEDVDLNVFIRRRRRRRGCSGMSTFQNPCHLSTRKSKSPRALSKRTRSCWKTPSISCSRPYRRPRRRLQQINGQNSYKDKTRIVIKVP